MNLQQCLENFKFHPSIQMVAMVSTKLFQSRWLDIDLNHFGPQCLTVHKHTKKNLAILFAILTSHLVNNSFVL